MDVHIAKTLFDAIDASLKGLIGTGTAHVMLAAGALFGCAYLINILIKGIGWMMQGLDIAFNELLWDLVKAAMITFFAFSTTFYVNSIVPIVSDVPTEIAQLLSNTVSSNNQIDTLIGAFIDSITKLVQAMKFNPLTSDFSTIATGILSLGFMLFGGAGFLIVAVGTLITLKVATVVLLAVGPVFIAFSLFPATRQYFWGWVSVLAGFMLTMVLFAVVINLEISFINANIVKDGVMQSDILSAISILIYFAAFTKLATELPGYAAAIMGGAGHEAGGLGSRIPGAGAAMAMGRGIRNRAGKAGKAGKTVWQRIRNRNRIG